MTAPAPSSGENSSLAIKCMDFCHALASQGMAFSFSLSVGSDFSFSLDARDKKEAIPVLTAEVTKKKLSPSQVRRNARRRQEFLKRKSETSGKEKLRSPVVGGIPPAPAQPFPSSRLVTKLRRRANTWTFSQLDGALPSPPSSPSGRPKESESEVASPTSLSPPLSSTATSPPSTTAEPPPAARSRPRGGFDYYSLVYIRTSIEGAYSLCYDALS